MDRRTTDEQLRDWPHDPATVCNWVRVVLKKGDISFMKNIKEFSVRAHVVHGMARLYLNRHIDHLDESLTGCQIKERVRRLQDQVRARMDAHSPADQGYHSAEGAIPPELQQQVADSEARWKKKRVNTEEVIEVKNQTMPDAVAPIDEVFARARPTALVAERDCSMLTEHADQVKVAMSEYSILNVQCATRFEDQFIPLCLPRIYPWSLNF